jgi:8-oxo-dGTP pyrophosphatase MutT (NUDIX family)
LLRELHEELGVTINAGSAEYIGVFEAEAANEPGHLVRAELFNVAIGDVVSAGAELAEAVWVSRAESSALPLAPLTRRHVLGLD